MHVTIPHELSKDEVRERLKSKSHKLADLIPGGMAEVTSSWPTADRMMLIVTAVGQRVEADILIEDRQLIVDVKLPMMLSFMEPAIKGAVEDHGHRLLTRR